jgi:hypothetical protein
MAKKRTSRSLVSRAMKIAFAKITRSKKYTKNLKKNNHIQNQYAKYKTMVRQGIWSFREDFAVHVHEYTEYFKENSSGVFGWDVISCFLIGLEGKPFESASYGTISGIINI